MKRIIFAALVGVLVSGPVNGGDLDKGIPLDDYRWEQLSGTSKNNNQPLTIEQLSKVYKKLNARNNPKTVWGSLEASALARDVACTKAVGNERLCRCLGEGLPVYLTFKSYVAIVTGEKNLNFSGLTAVEIKKVIERTIDVREKCVIGHRNKP